MNKTDEDGNEEEVYDCACDLRVSLCWEPMTWVAIYTISGIIVFIMLVVPLYDENIDNV